MRRISNFSVIVGFVFLFACSEEPSAKVPSAVTPEPVVGVDVDEESNKFDANAVVFKTKDFFNNSDCNLKIAVVPHEEEGEDHDHDHEDVELVAKLEYSVHGISATDSIGEFWRYDPDPKVKKYFPLDSTEAGAEPVLISYALNIERPTDLDELGILNNLEEYSKSLAPDNETLKLKQYVRVDFNAGSSAEEFAEAVEAVSDDPTQFSAHKSALEQVSRVIGKLGHGDHADPVLCNYTDGASGVEMTSFDLEAKDHDHD